MTGPRVFISYSPTDADRDWVRSFAQSLQRRGARVWLDEFEVAPGDPVREAAEQGLRESDVIVSVISPESVKQPNLYFEIGAAVGMGKRMVAVIPKDLDAGLLPRPLRMRRYLIQDSPEKTAEALLASEPMHPAGVGN
jgi:hypothetical protein